MATEITVPALGESVTEGTIAEWLKQPGDAVAADEPIVSLETDKVAVDVPSPVAGVMSEHRVAVGDTVEVGAVIAVVDEGATASAPKPTPTPTPAPAAAKADTAAPAPAASEELLNAAQTMSPAVRRAVLEHGVDPSTIKGSGKDGRLTKEDVLAAAEAKAKGGTPAPAPAPTPAATPAPTGGARGEERVKMTRMRQTIAKRLKGAQEQAALLTTFNDCDMSAVMEARDKYKDLFAKKHDIRLGFMGFFAKAACLALKDVPSANAYIEGDEIVYHDYVDISVAVSAPNGLVVPVIRDADKKGFARIEQDIADFGARAKAGTLTMDDMSGGTFTISNGGVFGSLMSTPIINPPQSAVLGLH
ncbi:MAG: 2-oxoglutarate dehydrogenase complex dihydrolipoyllysine-residue succinyltransferase, partial [Alphaproteobacteria bacterium]|nr:2-oxoglutarate dehydrogenase complex dihydrolipoyllysine-residue succinyltransferase [Alphaproteobacteria bacterium]